MPDDLLPTRTWTSAISWTCRHRLTGSIGNYVWLDANRDGIQNDGNSGLGGVQVNLTGSNVYGQSIALTTTTDYSPGYYLFTGLCQGDYTASIPNHPPGLVPTASLSSNGNDGQIYDSNNPAGTAVHLPDDLTSNQNVDFGYVVDFGQIPTCTGSIGNYVWPDANRDGIQNDGNSGLGGVQVKLTGSNVYGQSIALTTTTDYSPGYYLFTGLCRGDYTASLPNHPPGLVPTAPLSSNGHDGQIYDSNNPAGTAVHLSDNHASNQNVDFGYVAPILTASLGDRVWEVPTATGYRMPANRVFPL